MENQPGGTLKSATSHSWLRNITLHVKDFLSDSREQWKTKFHNCACFKVSLHRQRHDLFLFFPNFHSSLLLLCFSIPPSHHTALVLRWLMFQVPSPPPIIPTSSLSVLPSLYLAAAVMKFSLWSSCLCFFYSSQDLTSAFPFFSFKFCHTWQCLWSCYCSRGPQLFCSWAAPECVAATNGVGLLGTLWCTICVETSNPH